MHKTSKPFNLGDRNMFRYELLPKIMVSKTRAAIYALDEISILNAPTLYII